jgi:hypothetical protein
VGLPAAAEATRCNPVGVVGSLMLLLFLTLGLLEGSITLCTKVVVLVVPAGALAEPHG